MALESLEALKRTFEAGQVLIRQGGKSDGFYILRMGVAEVVMGDKVVGTIECSGDLEFVGEVGALLNLQRTAWVIAKTKCITFWIPTSNLESIITSSPTLGIKLARSLARKLANLQDTADGNGNKAAASGGSTARGLG